MNGKVGPTMALSPAAHGERPSDRSDSLPARTTESSRNRSHRRRDVDPHRALPVIADCDGSELSADVPRVRPIELPSTNIVPDYSQPAVNFPYPPHYIRFDPVPESQRTHYVEFEAMEDDLKKLRDLQDQFKVNERIFGLEVMEKFIDAWEQDTQKGEIIPLDRARVIIVEELNESSYWKDSPGSDIISKLYSYWSDRRLLLKHALVRKFWKSESANDHWLREVFQPRNHERMRLRGSRRDDHDTQSKVVPMQMGRLKKNLEQVTELIQCICKREQLKEVHCQLKIKSFDLEKNERLGQMPETEECRDLLATVGRLLKDAEILRRNSSIIQLETREAENPRPEPLPPKPIAPQPYPATPEPPQNVCLELAMCACAVIPYAERQGQWPIVGPPRLVEPWPVEPSPLPQQTEEQPVCRGRVMRGRGRKLALDRLMKALCTMQWNSYRGESGRYHEFDEDSKQLNGAEEEENDGFRELHKFIQNQFKQFNKQRRGLAH